MDYFKIQIDGSQFKQAYLIYIIEITNEKSGTYYYVGQTGDRNHLTARPAFRRLSAHLSDQGYSKENQLYRAIVNKILNIEDYSKGSFGNNIKNTVSEYLISSTITMHVFPLKDFISDCSFEIHTDNRKYVEGIETSIIHKLKVKFGEERILNKKIPKSSMHDQETSEIVNQILRAVCP